MEQLRKQAKERLHQLRDAGSEAATLADAQLALAREYGFESWPKLVHHIDAVLASGRLEQFESLARDLVTAYRTGESAAMQRIWDHFGHRRTWETFRTYVQL